VPPVPRIFIVRNLSFAMSRLTSDPASNISEVVTAICALSSVPLHRGFRVGRVARLAVHFETARVEVELTVISLFRIDGVSLFAA